MSESVPHARPVTRPAPRPPDRTVPAGSPTAPGHRGTRPPSPSPAEGLGYSPGGPAGPVQRHRLKSRLNSLAGPGIRPGYYRRDHPSTVSESPLTRPPQPGSATVTIVRNLVTFICTQGRLGGRRRAAARAAELSAPAYFPSLTQGYRTVTAVVCPIGNRIVG